MRLIPYFHNRHSEQSRGCNAAAEGGEARLSIPLPDSPVTSRDVSTSLDMTGGRRATVQLRAARRPRSGQPVSILSFAG